ncbi:MAG: hypothetical protein CVT92_10975 [Bacteroidetes bacterium HGW-Bacteroidetes-1]|jgi:protein TonB|nr:MAG: hypothetical protein CVT92_10975 [Bacteroidetes bacterium HGW-Bacteroidetes-1]
MSDQRKKKKFLNLPQYIGGKKAFIDFIQKNIRYPKEALQSGIEGRVLVEYEISDNGIVLNSRVVKGIGYGCDEEALRLVNLLQYEKVKNLGVRVKTNTKTFINFKLPSRITYTVTSSKKEEKIPDKPTSNTYGYTIKF